MGLGRVCSEITSTSLWGDALKRLNDMKQGVGGQQKLSNKDDGDDFIYECSLNIIGFRLVCIYVM